MAGPSAPAAERRPRPYEGVAKIRPGNAWAFRGRQRKPDGFRYLARTSLAAPSTPRPPPGWPAATAII